MILKNRCICGAGLYWLMKSSLLNFQKFCICFKNDYYLKLNYINTQLYSTKSKDDKYSKYSLYSEIQTIVLL